MSSKRAAVSSPTEGDNSSAGYAPTAQNEVSPEELPPADTQKRGQKKGKKMELLALQEGDSGTRPHVQVEHKPGWNMKTSKFRGGV